MLVNDYRYRGKLGGSGRAEHSGSVAYTLLFQDEGQFPTEPEIRNSAFCLLMSDDGFLIKLINYFAVLSCLPSIAHCHVTYTVC